MNDLRKNYVNGRWMDWSGDAIDVYEGTHGQVIARVPASDRATMEQAVSAADAAFESWSALPLEERLGFIEKMLQGLKDRAPEIAETVAREVGMPLKLSTIIQAGVPIQATEQYLELIREFPFTETHGNSEVQQVPVGVVGCITPWNYPLYQVVLKVVPAMAVGCTVVLKPSEVSPQTAFILADIVDSIGLPAGVFNLVCGHGQDVGDALIRHPQVKMISFTGSTRTGHLIAHAAADDFKRIALEMGGKSASVILPDADLASSVKSTFMNCQQNSGQTCMSLTRMLVHKDQHDEACEIAATHANRLKLGDPLAEDTRMGPLASKDQLDRVTDYIRLGIEEGATLIAGGVDPVEGLEDGYFVRPTVLGNVDPDSRVAQEEIFGPVLCVIPYDTEEDAIRIANGTAYGLSGAVFSGDQERAKRVAGKLRTGQVYVNGGAFNTLAPFGGFGHSGIGRELGKWGLEEFLEVRALNL